jgi:hypothetical protein
MVLLAIRHFDTLETRVITKRGLAYLASKRKKNGYYCFLNHGIDPDLDDVCLLNSLMQSLHVADTFDHTRLALAISQLPTCEGLFQTWIRPDRRASNDWDECVNVNVIRFLYQNGISCGKSTAAIRTALFRERMGTLYYDSRFALPYLVSTLPAALRALLFRRRGHCVPLNSGGFKDTVLDMAMQLAGLCGVGTPPDGLRKLSTELVKSQKADGCWPSVGAFRAFNFWGSRELTTAVVLDALAQYRRLAIFCA